MSVHVLSWVLKHSPVDTPGHRLVLLVLADHANDDGSGAWPSVDTIAAEAKLKRRNVQYALRSLESQGHVKAGGRSPYGTTIYHVLMRGGANIAPPVEGGANSAPGGATVAPKPSEPSIVPGLESPGTTTSGTSDGLDGLGANVAPLIAPQGLGPARRAWSQILDLCRPEVSDFTAAMWLQPIEALAVGDDELLLAAPRHIRSWVTERYSELLESKASEVLGRPVRVNLVEPPAESEAA